MPQPWKHSKTHVYYYRKVVPPHLREALGRTEFRISLGTKDLREAKRRYVEKVAEVDAIIAQASGGPVTLTHKQIIALAGRWYIQKVQEHEDNPGDALGWEVWADGLRDTYLDENRIPDFVGTEADKLLRAEGLVLDERGRKALEETLLSNAIDLSNTLINRADGDYRPDPLVERIPEWQ